MALRGVVEGRWDEGNIPSIVIGRTEVVRARGPAQPEGGLEVTARAVRRSWGSTTARSASTSTVIFVRWHWGYVRVPVKLSHDETVLHFTTFGTIILCTIKCAYYIII